MKFFGRVKPEKIRRSSAGGLRQNFQWFPRLRRLRVGTLMVAPCNPSCGLSSDILRRFDVVRDHLPVRSITVASGEDPYADIDWSQQLAKDWGGTFINAGRIGHINADSDLGSWVYGQILLDVLRTRVSS